jgi:hypothetical protein
MTAPPRPVRPARRYEVCEIQHLGTTIELPSAEVDRNGGVAHHQGQEFTIQWRPEAA